MGFILIDTGTPEDHFCEDSLPNVYDYWQGAVIECDVCGQRWWHNRFHVWDKTNYGKDK